MSVTTIEIQSTTAILLTSQAQRQGVSLDAYLNVLASGENASVAPHLVWPSSHTDWQEETEKFKQSLAWIENHCAEYDGQWVCLEGALLISHGPDALQVHNEAKAKGIDSPLLEYMEKDPLPFGGW